VSKARQKGTSFETEVVNYLKEHRIVNATRLPMSSPLGDIDGTGVVLECKNQKTMTLAAWVDQAAKAGEVAQKRFFVIHKRPRKNVSEAYVTLTLKDLPGLLVLLQANSMGPNVDPYDTIMETVRPLVREKHESLL
jgi:hypothetical protein